MPTRRVISCSGPTIGTSDATVYCCPLLPTVLTTSQSLATMRALTPLIFRKQHWGLVTPPGASKSFVFDLLVDGVETDHTGTITGTGTPTLDIDEIAEVPAGSTFVQRITRVGGPASSDIRDYGCVVDGRVSGAVQYGGVPSGVIDAMLQVFQPVTNYATVLPWVVDVAPTPGTITEIEINLSAAPGAGKSRTVTLYDDAVAQPLVITIADTDTQAIWTGAFAFARLSRLQWQTTSSGGPAASNISLAIKVVHATDGESIIAGMGNSGLPFSGAQPRYTDPFGLLGFNNTESNVDGYVVSPFSLRNYHGRSASGPGGTEEDPYGWTLTTRQNGANTALTASIVQGIDENRNCADLDNSADFVEGDRWALRGDIIGDPSGGVVLAQSWVQYALAEPMTGVIGPLAWVHRMRRQP